MSEERVQKLLARAGLGSRRRCEQMVVAGRVAVNGRVASLGDKADPARDSVEVDGIPVDLSGRTVVYAVHKPRGVVSTSSDTEGRLAVADLVPRDPRVYSVGRLDADSEGLLLLTNDGDLAYLVAHPSHGVEKTYLVEATALGARDLKRLRRGVELDDGRTAPARVRPVSRAQGRLAFEITIHEGRNRQVRRMVAAVGGHVLRLVRISIGPVSLGRLGPGSWRRLSVEEVTALRRAAMGRGA